MPWPTPTDDQIREQTKWFQEKYPGMGAEEAEIKSCILVAAENREDADLIWQICLASGTPLPYSEEEDKNYPSTEIYDRFRSDPRRNRLQKISFTKEEPK